MNRLLSLSHSFLQLAICCPSRSIWFIVLFHTWKGIFRFAKENFTTCTRQCRTQFFQTYQIFASKPKHRLKALFANDNKFVFLIGIVIHCFIPQLRKKNHQWVSSAFVSLFYRCDAFVCTAVLAVQFFVWIFAVESCVWKQQNTLRPKNSLPPKHTQTGMQSSRCVYYMEKPQTVCFSLLTACGHECAFLFIAFIVFRVIWTKKWKEEKQTKIPNWNGCVFTTTMFLVRF